METNKMGIQEYLSLGYLYLLVVGLLSDVVFYRFLDMNILNYSSFLDILITPINLLTANVVVPTALVITGIVAYFANKYIEKQKFEKEKIEKKEYYAENKEKMEEDFKTKTQKKFIIMMAMMTLGFYSGLAIGMGSVTNMNIKEGKLTPNYNLVFNNGKSMNVHIIGQNSVYVFYIPENSKQIIITPIINMISEMKKIETKSKR